MGKPTRKRYSGTIAFRPAETKSYVGEPQSRQQELEITRAELEAMQPHIAGLPLRYYHDDDDNDIGTITRMYFDSAGSACVEFELDESAPGAAVAKPLIQAGIITGLSLQHDRYTNRPTEVSLCIDGARPKTRLHSLTPTEVPHADAAGETANKEAPGYPQCTGPETTPRQTSSRFISASDSYMEVALREIPPSANNTKNKMSAPSQPAAPQSQSQPQSVHSEFVNNVQKHASKPRTSPAGTADQGVTQDAQLMQQFQEFQKFMNAQKAKEALEKATGTAPTETKTKTKKSKPARDTSGKFTKPSETDAGAEAEQQAEPSEEEMIKAIAGNTAIPHALKMAFMKRFAQENRQQQEAAEEAERLKQELERYKLKTNQTLMKTMVPFMSKFMNAHGMNATQRSALVSAAEQPGGMEIMRTLMEADTMNSSGKAEAVGDKQDEEDEDPHEMSKRQVNADTVGEIPGASYNPVSDVLPPGAQHSGQSWQQQQQQQDAEFEQEEEEEEEDAEMSSEDDQVKSDLAKYLAAYEQMKRSNRRDASDSGRSRGAATKKRRPPVGGRTRFNASSNKKSKRSAQSFHPSGNQQQQHDGFGPNSHPFARDVNRSLGLVSASEQYGWTQEGLVSAADDNKPWFQRGVAHPEVQKLLDEVSGQGFRWNPRGVIARAEAMGGIMPPGFLGVVGNHRMA